MRLRRSAEPWVRDWWSGGGGAAGAALTALSLPLEAFFRSIVAARALGYERGVLKSWRAPIPVISIGNLTVGGTGKTPVTGWVVRKLQKMGARPAVLLRGYGADEALLHRRWTPETQVLADPDRVAAAARAALAGATVAVLDDGMQHRRLARDLELVLVAAEQPWPGRMLPRGPYREPVSALARADLVVVTRRTAEDARVEETLHRVSLLASERPTAVLRLGACAWTDLGGAPASAPSGPLLAVAAIADPGLFAHLVREAAGASPESLVFPDHHDFDESDARRIRTAAGTRTVVVTEKDAVKLVALEADLPTVRVLTLSVQPERGGRAIDEALARTLAEGARR